MVCAEDLSYEKVFDSLRRGDFYASCGPEFHELSIDEGIVRVRSSPVEYVNISTDNRLLFSKKAEEELLTDTELDIRWYLDLSKEGVNEHKYIRVTLIDKFGKTAYSRAYFTDELN